MISGRCAVKLNALGALAKERIRTAMGIGDSPDPQVK
jgi:hypothetical protein